MAKTPTVKTGILKRSVNAGPDMPPSTGTRLTAKVGPRFYQLELSRRSCDQNKKISSNSGCKKKPLAGFMDGYREDFIEAVLTILFLLSNPYF